VYPDYSEGNWCEGLTVYFADYRYKEAISDSAAADYRRTLVTDFTSYVNDDNDFPLSSFKERTTAASRAIGYGKGAFVFHMLRRMLGDETFYRALRTYYEKYQFKVASWDDIENIFEKTSGKDLHFYFEQWVRRRGAPLLSLESARVDSVKEAFEVHVRLKQDPVYRILVPICVSGADTSCERKVWLASDDTTIGLRCGSRYDVFRRLDPFEVAPTISAVLGDEKLLIVLPTRAESAKRTAFDALAAQLNRTGESTVKEDTTVTVADLEKSSLLVLGGSEENLLLSIMSPPSGIELTRDVITVAGRTYSKPGNSAFITFRSPFNARRSVCVITGASAASVEKSGYKIIHYGKYSFVTFIDGNKIDAGVLPVAGNPMAASLE
jgi:aminopeptidase N